MVRVFTAALLCHLGLAAAPVAAQVNLNDLLAEEPAAAEASAAPAATAAPASEPAATGDTATRLQAAARMVEPAVALVVLVLPDEAGGFQTVPFGTAWAFEPARLGTNTHITADVEKALEAGVEAYVLRNKSRGESYRIRRAVSHPRYAEARPNAFGQMPVGIPYDVGILEIDGAFPATVQLADTATLHGIGSGTPLAFIGFPMERLSGGNVNISNPIATLQTGIVTSISDFYLEDRGPAENLLIRHNLPATGGASGSPVFTADGQVVGTLNAVNMNLVEYTTKGGTQQFRVPSAAQINYAQRIDILADIIDR